MAAGAVIAVLALGGLGAARWWFPHYRPDLRAGERYGIDVASHQGRVDWERVAGCVEVIPCIAELADSEDF